MPYSAGSYVLGAFVALLWQEYPLSRVSINSAKFVTRKKIVRVNLFDNTHLALYVSHFLVKSLKWSWLFNLCWTTNKHLKNAFMNIRICVSLKKFTACLRSLSEAYLEPSRTSIRERFAKKVNYFCKKSSLINVLPGSKYGSASFYPIYGEMGL